MSGRPGSTSGNELLDSLLSNIGQAGASASPLGTLLSTLGQPQPGSSTSSRLSPSPLLSSASAEVAQPAISPLLLGAGKLLLQNWQPVLQAGKALASAGGALGGSGAVAAATGAAGVGLVTAGVARLGLSLLERRLQRRSAAARPDPLRGISAKSRTKTKSRKGSSASSGTSHDSGNQVIDLTVDSPLQQLNALFPHLETHALSAVLASTNNSLAEAVEVVLAQSTDLPTPGSSSGPTTTSMPPLLSPSSSSPLPPCPECPVCLSSLRGCRIYQCKEGHSLCHQCKNNPQVRCCPTCRGKLTGRATNLEQLLAAIYGNGNP